MQHRSESTIDPRAFAHRADKSITAIADATRERGCQCVPYADVFTFRRWRLQGHRVMRGEKALARVGRRGFTAVFCRCQVEPVPDGDAEPPTAPTAPKAEATPNVQPASKAKAKPKATPKAKPDPKPTTSDADSGEWWQRTPDAADREICDTLDATRCPPAVAHLDGHRARDFGRVLDQVLAATGDDSRPILQHVQVQAIGDRLRHVAADGYRLGVVEFQVQLDRPALLARPALYHCDALRDIARALKRCRLRDTATLTVTAEPHGSTTHRTMAVTTTRRDEAATAEAREFTDGQFPAWPQLVPAETDHERAAYNGRILAWAATFCAEISEHNAVRLAHMDATKPGRFESVGERGGRALAVVMPTAIA